MTVRLRAHHLLCMLTFVGEGYTPSFTANYRRIAARLSGREPIEIVEGPDDICAPLLAGHEPHCRRRSVTERDGHALEAVSALLGSPCRVGTILVPDAAFLARMRTAFAAGHLRHACTDCEWSQLCTGIAGDGFSGTLVSPIA